MGGCGGERGVGVKVTRVQADHQMFLKFNTFFSSSHLSVVSRVGLTFCIISNQLSLSLCLSF